MPGAASVCADSSDNPRDTRVATQSRGSFPEPNHRGSNADGAYTVAQAATPEAGGQMPSRRYHEAQKGTQVTT